MAAALTLLELSRGASSEAFALPSRARSVQQEEVRRVSMYDCPGLTPIAPKATPKRTWADMATNPKELGAYAATSGPKRLVVKRTRDMEQVDEDEEQKGVASEDESDVDYHSLNRR